MSVTTTDRFNVGQVIINMLPDDASQAVANTLVDDSSEERAQRRSSVPRP